MDATNYKLNINDMNDVAMCIQDKFDPLTIEELEAKVIYTLFLMVKTSENQVPGFHRERYEIFAEIARNAMRLSGRQIDIDITGIAMAIVNETRKDMPKM